ncbi:amino acid permease-domain-containing protein [Thelonectria olida]|uniref:Amino acid permease-domain-containing protein n=1 Tax=Thelonectria olida TaxID=1576542 RepID=A0A9P8W0B5_9HYPO|nr:amino acid permease-domain-containing protein [Thelonectria olida]
MAVDHITSPAADEKRAGPKQMFADENAPSVRDDSETQPQAYEQETFATRNGLNLESFKKRHYGLGLVELDRKMKPRHLNMIAIGGSIGAGFYVGSGSALAKGGPGTLFVDFLIISIMVFNVVYALGELAIMFPVSGGFYTYSTRFIDPSFGFAMAWNYAFQWAVTLPLELTVCSITISYWNDEVSPGVWIAIFLLAIIVLNMFGTLGYAEEEFWAACFKLASTSIFIIIALVLVNGGGPKSGRYSEYWGTKYWEGPDVFKNGFKGFCSVFVTAAFSFAGTELVGLAAAESKNPTEAVPGAIKQVFWRISMFYIIGLFFIGLLIDCNDPSLLSASSNSSKASPFVLVGKYAGLHGLDHYMNVVILSSVLSIGIASVYGGSRTLTAVSQQGYGPKIFTYIDKAGRPLPSVAAIIVFGFLAFLNLDGSGTTIFEWLQALSGLATLFSWGSICLAHIRFRSAWKHHGHTLDEIPFQAIGGVYGSWVGLTFIILILIAQFYTAIVAPPGESGMGTVEDFFKSYLGFPIMLLFWAIGYLWKRSGWLKLTDIDIDTGRREHDWDAIRANRELIASYPFWKRMIYFLF